MYEEAIEIEGKAYTVRYEPAESQTGLFGGNSNWRGPIWMPMNMLLVESLQKFHHYYGDEFTVELPMGSGRKGTLLDAADEIARIAASIAISLVASIPQFCAVSACSGYLFSTMGNGPSDLGGGDKKKDQAPKKKRVRMICSCPRPVKQDLTLEPPPRPVPPPSGTSPSR